MGGRAGGWQIGVERWTEERGQETACPGKEMADRHPITAHHITCLVVVVGHCLGPGLRHTLVLALQALLLFFNALPSAWHSAHRQMETGVAV